MRKAHRFAAATFAFALSSAFATPASAHLRDCSQFFYALAQDTIARREFNDGRAYRDYVFGLGDEFEATLKTFGKEDLWLDAGTGQGFAPAGFVLQQRRGRALGVTFERRGSALVSLAGLVARRRLSFLEGRLIEEIPAAELGHPRLITDVFGPLSYSHEIGPVLQKYLEVLAPGGKLLLSVATDGRNKFRWGEETLDFVQFLSRIDGLEVSSVVDKPGLIVVRKRRADVVVPPLQLLDYQVFEKAPPPGRTYQVTRP